ncbi:tRNA uridine-5-carboxymethylaminomethyl(34) synthesis GTPase MnmE [Desulfoplanes formicivorans]|uniref:tRNA modification GTPase MnmE n=1 Tax=Desulfoplanes formicivorans TaxID=1592317 RepID=A0A194AIS9_9BACT|nr:tRNA uridine-5-carboxymethylaminomethyl(34) synthesis GTPase MnmE [Desulfoplanes formicivorans]GAU08654.1 tRNA modification GTPase TrmE [Desulfoplanes formicivorans]
MQSTIAAIATPLGSGGVGIIRISGPVSKLLGQRIFRSSRSGFTDFRPYVLHHGTVLDARGTTLDEVLISYMPGPGSYTGEDVIEINCHGGPLVLQAVLERVLELGAIPACPGEFTKRAFLNGRLDLTQAEAVAEMIEGRSVQGLAMAASKLGGLLGDKLRALRNALEELKIELCVAVDFPEDEVECLEPEAFARRVEGVLDETRELIAAYARNRCWREGALVVLAGRVNAGKSSLMNGLLGRDRAIVTNVPGTTRDYLEETIVLGGMTIRLVDTAGLRETRDQVEQVGVERTRALLQEADLVLLLIDGSRGPDQEDESLARSLPREKLVVVGNKVDVCGEEPGWKRTWEEAGYAPLMLSARQGTHLDRLEAVIIQCLTRGQAEADQGGLVPNLRQKQGLEQGAKALEALLDDLKAGVPYDLLAVHVDAACTAFMELTGEITSDEVLNAIFKDFCIGK